MSTLFAGRACLDPAGLARELADRQIPTPWFGTANVMSVPLGKGPGRGRVLLRKSDLDAIDQAADHDLSLRDPAGNVVPLKRITLLRAECLAPGAAADGTAAYLCELADRRWHLARVPIDVAYNVRDGDGADYLPSSTNSGTPWTWQQVATELTTALGLPTMTLPFTPDGTPENLLHFGGWAWDAYCGLLDRLACAPKLDPTTDTFTLVRLGDAAAVATFDAARAQLAGVRTWDAYPVEPARGRRPQKVRVLFPRRPQPQDGTSVYHHVDVTLAAAAGVVAGSYATLHDDLTADGPTAGSPDNAAALATRAAERAADWLRKLTGFDRRLGLVYRDDRAEAVPQLLGAAAGAVLFDDRGGPVRTEVRAGPDGALEAWRPYEQPLVLGCCGTGWDYETYTRWHGGEPTGVGATSFSIVYGVGTYPLPQTRIKLPGAPGVIYRLTGSAEGIARIYSGGLVSTLNNDLFAGLYAHLAVVSGSLTRVSRQWTNLSTPNTMLLSAVEFFDSEAEEAAPDFFSYDHNAGADYRGFGLGRRPLDAMLWVQCDTDTVIEWRLGWSLSGGARDILGDVSASAWLSYDKLCCTPTPPADPPESNTPAPFVVSVWFTIDPDNSSLVTFWANVFGGSGSYSYLWDFGDGDTSTAASPVTHLYTGGSSTASVVIDDGVNPSVTVNPIEPIA